MQAPPILQGSEALLRVLADLLLGALGQGIEGLENESGGDDEPEDHA